MTPNETFSSLPSPLTLVLVSPEGRIERIRGKGAELFHLKEGDFVLSAPAEFPDPEAGLVLAEGLGRYVFEHQGKTFYLESQRREDGGLTAFLVDVTAVLKRQFLNFDLIDALASELVTPLSALTMELSLAEETGLTREEARSLRALAVEAGVRSNDLLSVLGAHLRALKISETNFVLDEFLRNLVEKDSRYQDVTVDCPPFIAVRTDRDLLAVAVRGLLDTARDLSTAPPVLRGAQRLEAAIVEVRIDGVGSAEDGRRHGGEILARLIADTLRIPFWSTQVPGGRLLSLRVPLL
ncbi:MAG: sensor histidine kinase [Candidatus Hydrogenedentota bacterium]|nr:MAG: sensor histidine kinase [Candidatus Hydrogenedentota bacterium]